MTVLVALFLLAFIFCVIGGGYVLFPPGIFLLTLSFSIIFLAPVLAAFAAVTMPWGAKPDETWLTTVRIIGVCLFVWGLAEQMRGDW